MQRVEDQVEVAGLVVHRAARLDDMQPRGAVAIDRLGEGRLAAQQLRKTGLGLVEFAASVGQREGVGQRRVGIVDLDQNGAAFPRHGAGERKAGAGRGRFRHR